MAINLPLPPAMPARAPVAQPHPHRFRIAALYFFLPMLVFATTSLPGISRLTPFVTLLLLAFLVSAAWLPKIPRAVVVVLWALFVLTLVGSSGWFFSPFFFTLYLLAIALGFVYTPLIAVTFTVSLLIIFAASIGEVSPTADFLTLISLLSVIPITIVLRKSFLLVQQEKRGILILESDQKNTALTSLDAVLTNQINNLAVIIRQPITYIRQGLALLKDNALTDEEYPHVIQRMSRAADEVFTLVKEFESGTTKNDLVSRNTSSQNENNNITPLQKKYDGKK